MGLRGDENTNNKELCLELVKADSESEVIEILKNEGYWDDPKFWRFYGDKENNFSTIGNQQSSSDAALVEKIVNSVDAVLLRECLRRGIDPESEDAPESLEEATEEFFNIKDGSLRNLNSRERTELAENILMVATGKKTNPSYSIIDKGEGQTPCKMPNTFLSLTESNKLRIPFVQGKFNMGGSGALRFCGNQNIQLLLSKKDPQIRIDDDSSNLWGFTVIRREDPSANMKSSTFKYLVINNEIARFEADSLPLLPGEYPEAYKEPLKWGTFIKLYEYQIGPFKTLINFDLNYRLSMLLPNIALPIRLEERRKGYTGHSFNSTLSGLTVRLEEDRSKNIEDNFPSSDLIKVSGQEMSVKVYAFKKDSNVNKYKKNEGIVFTINGQAHAFISKSFFKRKSVGMSYLSDSIFVIADCSNFDGREREDLFMNSRDRLGSCDLKSQIEKELERLIKEHRGLKELREKRRREEIGDKLKDSKPLADVIQDVIKKSPGLFKVLVNGERINNPFSLVDKGTTDKFNGKMFPTYFKLTKDFNVNKPKKCPINSKFRLKFETDAENDYFKRDTDQGQFKISCKNHSVRDYGLKLWNGIANLNCELPEDVEIGDLIEYTVEVDDISQRDPFITNFYINVSPKVDKVTSKPGKRINPPGNKGKDRKGSSGLALPNIIEVYKEKWDSYGFDKESALSIKDSGGEGYDFYVNMDNVYLMTEIKARTKDEPEILKKQYQYGMVLIGLSLLNSFDGKENNNGYSVTDTVDQVSEAIAPMILPMISSLGELEKNT